MGMSLSDLKQRQRLRDREDRSCGIVAVRLISVNGEFWPFPVVLLGFILITAKRRLPTHSGHFSVL